MDFGSWIDSKIKKLNWIDIGLIKFSCLALGILVAALIPSIIEINIWWIITVVALLAIKPAYKIFSK